VNKFETFINSKYKMEIEGYEDYLIYEDGRVFSKYVKRYLKHGANKQGYLHVGLSKNGKKKSCSIHRIVGIHYIPNPDNNPEVDHINKIKSDNRVENLRWVTKSENQQNTGLRKDNTSGIKNICYDKRNNRYEYTKKINRERHTKFFKTLEDAIAYKNQYEST
tara:strand:- start:1003 stop:1491 length:489 start_codon:yes stop_codon:yes gene_type:complete